MIHHDGTGAALLVLAVAAGYELLACRVSARGRPWSARRTAAFLTGCLLLVVALVGRGTGTFADHMTQHLLIGMFAPLGLVLGAPVTLLLRTLPPAAGRRLGRALHARGVRILAHPVTALILTAGGTVMLYLTPLYRHTLADPDLHAFVQLHFLASGYLFTWVIAGPDPAPRRPSVPARLVVLGVAIAVHAGLAQLLYAGSLIDVPATDAQRRAGATLMYYGGDVAELLVAVALLSTWRPAARRRPVSTRPVPAGRGVSPVPR